MPNAPSEVVVFKVVGELRGDPGHLLLESPDGSRYDYDIARGTVTPADPDTCWTVDTHIDSEVRLWKATPRVVA